MAHTYRNGRYESTIIPPEHIDVPAYLIDTDDLQLLIRQLLANGYDIRQYGFGAIAPNVEAIDWTDCDG